MGFGVVFCPSHFVQLVPGWPQGGDGLGVLFEKLPAAGGPRVLPKVGRAAQESWFLHPCSFFLNVDIYIYIIHVYYLYFFYVNIHIFISIEYMYIVMKLANRKELLLKNIPSLKPKLP